MLAAALADWVPTGGVVVCKVVFLGGLFADGVVNDYKQKVEEGGSGSTARVRGQQSSKCRVSGLRVEGF